MSKAGLEDASSARSPSRATEGDAIPDLTDELVVRAQGGDMQAWSRLYQNNFDRIFRGLCLHTSCADTAEDLAQETFAEALASLGSFKGTSRFSTWLHGIAINRARRHWRWKRNTATAHERLTHITRLRTPSAPDPARSSLQKTRVKVLYTILEGIPDNLREVFILRDLEGLSQHDVASQLGITQGNAAVRATRARARVRSELERLGWLDEKERTP